MSSSPFKNKRIAIIGDVMLDQYIEGESTRTSPEAPAPIVRSRRERDVLGGAANVAANVRSLGGLPTTFSVTGKDEAARRIKNLFKEAGIPAVLLADSQRPTTVKSRIATPERYLLRFDRESLRPLPAPIEANLIDAISRRLHLFDAIIFSDYAKGVCTRRLVAVIIALARRHKIPVITDTKPKNFRRFKNVTVLKSNQAEAESMAGTRNSAKAAIKISRALNCDVVTTLGHDGILVYMRKQQKNIRIKGIKVRLMDIVGAGDVVSASVALALASGYPLEAAARLANRAAALSVEKHGTATVSFKEVFQ